MKITIELNKSFKNLDGSEAEDTNLGRTLGNFLASSNKGDAIKLFAFGIDIFKGNPLEVDEADFKTIRDMVVENPGFNNLVEAQLLKALDDAKDAAKKKEEDSKLKKSE